ncbi:DegT/DnrJ/EryC1/StrS family aminotransferase [Coraliomargarita akajimensis]|uniref:Glutamine--scyllo-inositol transaminase n=1 Tax=Coraliomargarita akajimensis (strain DSM 45221 / IAM 15411 / JCM 23193 / KCTC 12865 / 04OKA010-24) TaxID=583355 RepID=D5EP41_CORAD|nr:DegT/DnrJ/EryC1/StrS family aminotransferase [Coraliomargarita akajimensis]ADE55551.1 Glutamine--scyllo-inositol transaminase [Coraliomargarita akajimensis DSM 45221]
MSEPISVPLLDLKPQYQALKPELDAAVAEVVASQYFILGPTVETFEKAAAEYCNVEHAIGVSSGTDALIVAMMAMGIGEGDEVITTPYTFFGTAGSITRVGATPVFVDIEPGSFNIDVRQIEAAITPRTRAIMPVHLFGQMADMRAIKQIAREHDLLVIEDAAQAIGAKQLGRPACSQGHMGCLSFFPTKNLGGFGDGGMVVTDDAEYANIARQLRNHGMEPKYYHSRVGGNFRLDALQAAVLNVKLPHLDSWHAQRAENACLYYQGFDTAGLKRSIEDLEAGSLKGGIVLPEVSANNDHIYNQFVIYTEDRDALRDHLLANKVGCEIYYPLALHEQECFRLLGYPKGSFQNAERAAAMSLALPIYPDLTPEMIQRVVDVVASFQR